MCPPTGALHAALHAPHFCLAWQDSRLDTPLHVAVRLGSMELLSALVKRGVRVDIKDTAQCTALHHALYSACAAKEGAEALATATINGEGAGAGQHHWCRI